MSRIRTAIVINSRANGGEPEYEEIRPDFCPACGHEVIDDEEYLLLLIFELRKMIMPNTM